MLAIRLGSLAVQDPPWGSVGALPIPAGPKPTMRLAQGRGVPETALGVSSHGGPVLSLTLFGLVKIDWWKEAP